MPYTYPLGNTWIPTEGYVYPSLGTTDLLKLSQKLNPSVKKLNSLYQCICTLETSHINVRKPEFKITLYFLYYRILYDSI